MSKDAAGTNLSRRDFIRNTTAGAATIAGTGLLQERSASAAIAANSQARKVSALSAKEALETEVLVIGAGTAGLAAAVSAAQAGAKVVLIDKSPTYTALGGDNTAIGSRLQKLKSTLMKSSAL